VTALNHRWNKRMLRAPHLIAALLITALSPAALAHEFGWGLWTYADGLRTRQQ
jgi:hypothetical protein